MSVIGIDPSLTSTGLCDAMGRARVVKTSGLEGPARLAHILGAVLDTFTESTTHAVIEGYSYASPYRSHQMGELGGVIRLAIWRAGIAWWDIPPLSLKKFATGDGRASKELMIDAAQAVLGYAGSQPDEADALWLWAFGRALIGQPLFRLDKIQQTIVKPFKAIGPHAGMRSGVVVDINPQGRML